ncbi:MAG: hypothetical protein H0X14_11840 [Acidobacteria bacterium]|nr:hypothetical protein [Acidobacteriota bacterium]
MSANEEMKGRERSLANLKPFRPGQSGNPSGRPKNVLSKALRKKLEEVESDAEGARSNADMIADKLVEVALGGNLEAIKIVLDRMEGRARQSINVTTDSRERIERAIDNLISTATQEGDTLSRDAALALLAEYDDEAAELLNA